MYQVYDGWLIPEREFPLGQLLDPFLKTGLRWCKVPHNNKKLQIAGTSRARFT